MCWHCDGRRTDPTSGDWCLFCKGTGVVEEDDGADEDDEEPSE
jgi:hypothetical protein